MKRQALILAAGSGRRMGRTKALVELGSVTFLERVLAPLADFERVVCVTGAEGDAIRAHLAGKGTREPLWIANPAPQRGRSASIQLGLSRLLAGEPFLLWPVDTPCVRAQTLAALYAQAPEELGWLIPTCGGRRGHPVLLGADLASRIAALAPDRPLRELQREADIEVREVPTEDEGILLDLNTPADLRAAERWLRGLPSQDERVSGRKRSRGPQE